MQNTHTVNLFSYAARPRNTRCAGAPAPLRFIIAELDAMQGGTTMAHGSALLDLPHNVLAHVFDSLVEDVDDTSIFNCFKGIAALRLCSRDCRTAVREWGPPEVRLIGTTDEGIGAALAAFPGAPNSLLRGHSLKWID